MEHEPGKLNSVTSDDVESVDAVDYHPDVVARLEDLQAMKKLLNIRMITSNALKVGIEPGLAAKLGERLVRLYKPIEIRKRTAEENRGKMLWQLTTADGRQIRVPRSKWHIIIRTLLSIPRDGNYYLIEDTEWMTRDQRDRARTSAKKWLNLAGYRGQYRIWARHPAGIMATWDVAEGCETRAEVPLKKQMKEEQKG